MWFRRSRLGLVVLAYAWATLATAGAESVKGNEALSWCQDEKGTIQRGMCLGFISGLVRMHDLSAHIYKENLFCRPKGTTLGQFEMITTQFMRSRPDLLHMPFEALVMFALQRAFPCHDRPQPEIPRGGPR